MRAVLTLAALLLSWQAFAAECVTVKYRDTTVWLGRGKVFLTASDVVLHLSASNLAERLW